MRLSDGEDEDEEEGGGEGERGFYLNGGSKALKLRLSVPRPYHS